MSIARIDDDLSGLPTPCQLNACTIVPSQAKVMVGSNRGSWCAGEGAQLSYSVHGGLSQECGKISCPSSTQSQIPLFVLRIRDRTKRAGLASRDVEACIMPDGHLGQLVHDATLSILPVADHAC